MKSYYQSRNHSNWALKYEIFLRNPPKTGANTFDFPCLTDFWPTVGPTERWAHAKMRDDRNLLPLTLLHTSECIIADLTIYIMIFVDSFG